MNFFKKTISLRRVVVTGIGLVSPMGVGTEESWERIKRGESGIGPTTRFDSSSYGSQISGEVKAFDPSLFMDHRETRRNDRFLHFAIAASKLAWQDAGLKELDPSEEESTGVSIGSGIGGLDTIAQNQDTLRTEGLRRITPTFIPGTIINMASGIVSQHFKARGPNLSTVTACATSTHSLGEAYRLIEAGYANIMLSGGTEAPITALGVAGFDIMRTLSRRNNPAEKASCPFDKTRDGFVIAEGAAVLVLEELEHAVRRNAKIYGELIGYGMSGDAYHQTAPDPEGRGAVRAMGEAIREAGIAPEEVDYINAHGTSTPLNDKIETLAIKKLFKEHAYKVSISSTKSMTGHLLGAAGSLESAFSLLAMRDSIVPPTINLENPDPECDLDYTPLKAKPKELRVVMSNSFGFGGTNAALVFRKL